VDLFVKLSTRPGPGILACLAMVIIAHITAISGWRPGYSRPGETALTTGGDLASAAVGQATAPWAQERGERP
jgi:hypothetical protein